MGGQYGESSRERTVQEFWSSFSKAYDVVSRHLSKNLDGLTLPQFEIMRIISEQGPLCQTEIARCALRSGPGMTSLLDALERSGLIARTRREDDRRYIVVELTQQGIDRLDRARPGFARSLAALFEHLPDEDLRKAAGICRRIAPWHPHESAVESGPRESE